MSAPRDIVDGRFELIEQLGSGGMGTVWRARDSVLHREVALKAVRQDAAFSGAVRERVLREARALARISHPNVVVIHHIVNDDPHPWIVMELVDGVSLQERLADGPLHPADAARLGRQVLGALRAADAAGIQHRDVKPANVLLRPDGSAVLTDFGIAALRGSTALTATGELIGSPEYIAPERIRGTDDDPASDLWSLGLVLYVCVEGVSPLRRATTLATLAAVLDEAVPPPVRSGPLAPVLQALLVRDPAARPDAARLDAMLAQAESGTAPNWALPTVTATLPPVPTRTPTDVVRPPHAPPGPGTGPDDDTVGGHSPRARLGHPPRHRPAAVVAAAAVVVVALATAATALVLTLNRPDDDRVAQGSGGATAATSSVTSTSASTNPARKPAPTPSPTPPSATATDPVPPRTSAPLPASQGHWIAQLYSEPVSSGTAARDRRLATIRRTVPEAAYLRSDDYASLRPGYWVILAPGPFTDGRAALAFCAERGRTTANTCIGRYLSTTSADFGLQCGPPAVAPAGRCTRR